MRRSQILSMLVLLAGAVLVDVGSRARPAAGQAQARDRPGQDRVQLASQSPWVGPGQELVLRVMVTTPRPPSEVELAVSVYRRLTSRSEFMRSFGGRPRGEPVSVTSRPLSAMAPDSAGAAVIRLPVQDPAQLAELPGLRLAAEGVYPVRVELREA